MFAIPVRSLLVLALLVVPTVLAHKRRCSAGHRFAGKKRCGGIHGKPTQSQGLTTVFSASPSPLSDIVYSSSQSPATSVVPIPSTTSKAIPAPSTSQPPLTSNTVLSTQSHVSSVTSHAPEQSQAPAQNQTTGTSNNDLIPRGNKAGIAGGDSYPFMKDHIGWWYDWSPTPEKADTGSPGAPIAVPMLWGTGTADAQDAARFSAFQLMDSAPAYVLGYEEPDCFGNGSSGVSVKDGASKWDELIAPLAAKGTKLGSPSMCKQADETWLAEFQAVIQHPWHFTAVHINKNNMDGVRKDLDHYWDKYKKPIWVTEFACVDDHNTFIPCTDQDEINGYITNIVDLFEADNRVVAYAYSDGMGLGVVWPTVRNGKLSESGKTYLKAISKYH